MTNMLSLSSLLLIFLHEKATQNLLPKYVQALRLIIYSYTLSGSMTQNYFLQQLPRLITLMMVNMSSRKIFTAYLFKICIGLTFALQSPIPQITSQSSSLPLPISIVERCYDAFNQGKMSQAAACFADKFRYDDGQYLGCITQKSELERFFEFQSNVILPSNSKVVLDNIAICETTGKTIGTRWHAVREDGSEIPLTRGCSFYTLENQTGLIETAFKVSEMLVKPSSTFSNNLVSSASQFMSSTSSPKPSSSTSPSSIIESYFEAWNKRDMETALSCFVDDCIYETEDPVFVNTFRGKEALQEHLLQNAASLPESCRIELDDLAIDTKRGTAGVRWHLEVNGVSIPNLRGCSMYTMEDTTTLNQNDSSDDTDDLDADSRQKVGLLTSGFDVTEAPVKLPRLFGVAPTIQMNNPFRFLN